MRAIGVGVVAVLWVALAAGCNSDGGNGDGGGGGTGGDSGLRTTVACDQPTAGVCSEYLNYPQESVEPLRTSCTMIAGTPGSSCVRTNTVGACTKPTENETSLRTLYYPPNYEPSNASTLEQVCTLYGGTWSAS